MIDSGIPNDPADWPDGVLAGLNAWEQGDVVANPPLFYFADPRTPVWEGTKAYTAESVGPEIVESPSSHSPPYGLVTSQTCDIGETDSKRPLRPWVQIAPIYAQTDSGWKKKIPRGGGPRYWLHVPALPKEEVWVADLRIEVPVEKGWLAQQPRIQGFATEKDKGAVGRRLAWIRGRPAFSPEFLATVVDPLTTRLRDFDPDDELAASVVEVIDEVAVSVDSALQPTVVTVTVLTRSALAPEEIEWLQEWRDGQVAPAADMGIDLLALDIRTLPDVTVEDYRRMIPVWRT